MSTVLNHRLALLAGIALGALGTALVLQLMPPRVASPAGETVEDAAQEPLYWVAPMDPDYRRDRPGKSPMGMDLVPVYAQAPAALAGQGVIEVSPAVVNNLGVRTVRVAGGELRTRITTVGYVKYDEDRLIHVHPRVEGWIEKLYVNAAGDPVRRGQPLYDLYSPQLVNAQEELLLGLKRNNARLVEAARDRLLALQLSASVIDALQRERQVQQTVTFLAPQDGVVDHLNIREGFYVKPGTTLMSVGSLEDVWVEAGVFERQAGLLEVGLPVTMTLDYLPGREWHGTVDYVYPSLDEKTRTLRVRLRFKNESALLKPNMFAQVVIHAKPDDAALLVPRAALIRTGSQQRVVQALGQGRFKSIAVITGRRDEHSVEILKGLEAGDEVVISAQFLLDSESSRESDFMRMEPPGSAASEAGHAHHHSAEGHHD